MVITYGSAKIPSALDGRPILASVPLFSLNVAVRFLKLYTLLKLEDFKSSDQKKLYVRKLEGRAGEQLRLARLLA
eukprot:scaffold22680_cov107-Cylindrotheca_fusiformis.AAC.12